MRLLLLFVEVLSVFLVVFYLYCRSPAFRPLRADWQQPPRGKVRLFLVFSFIGILGNVLGIPVVGGEAIVNARAVGSTLAGLLGGPVLGALVGVVSGAHRMTMGGSAAFPGAVATTLEGVLGGAVHLALRRTPQRLMTRKVAFLTTLVGEILHMGIVLFFSRPAANALEVVRTIAPPMILLNPVGALLFMTVLLERQREQDAVAAASSARALGIAQRALGLMSRPFGPEVAGEMARIVREETGVGAACVTDRELILGWVGLGDDHHLPGSPITSPFTRKSIAENVVTFADGIDSSYACRVTPRCPLDSMLIVPLHVDGQVVGTVQLFEPRNRRFLNMNKSLGEGMGALLSSQLLVGRYQEQKNLLVTSELKLLQAQVNPHFLFNALNTIIAVTRRDPARARELLVHLSHFFRKNLKRSGDLSTLAEELEHVSAYLEIEKARFQDRLTVETEVDPALLGLRLPTFTLQPLIENAIKHGLSATLGGGTARIRAYRRGGEAVIEIEDDAGAWAAPSVSEGGLGMKIVDRRIKDLHGPAFGVTVSCVPDELTRVSVVVPHREAA